MTTTILSSPRRARAAARPLTERPVEIILASHSPRRSLLLKKAGYHFKAVAAQVEESSNEQLTPVEMAQLNAYRKARAVAKKFPDFVVIGADTVVALENRIYGKPGTPQEARRMLASLQGKTHRVVTGVCLLHLRSHRQRLFSETSQVSFRALTPAEIAHYLDEIDPLDKAGGYGIQEEATAHILKKLKGSQSNVVGLPLESLAREMKEFSRA